MSSQQNTENRDQQSKDPKIKAFEEESYLFTYIMVVLCILGLIGYLVKDILYFYNR